METIDRLQRFLAAKRVNQLKRAHGLGRLQLSCLRIGRKEENQDGKIDQGARNPEGHPHRDNVGSYSARRRH